MPKLATYYIENYKIEVVRTFFGKERIFVNGTQVSEKSKDSNGKHLFVIDENRYQITQREASQAEKLNAFEILKNGSPIALVNIESENSVKMLLIIVAVGLGCGFMIGVLIYNMLQL
ncbi:MAG: hypothetical protein WA913_03885 [Pricia sp.]